MALQKHVPLITALLFIASLFTWPKVTFETKQRAARPTLDKRYLPLAERSIVPSATPH